MLFLVQGFATLNPGLDSSEVSRWLRFPVVAVLVGLILVFQVPGASLLD